MTIELKKIIDKYGIDSIRKELDLYEMISSKQTPEEWFKNLLSKMTIKQDREKYPNSLLFSLGDEVCMEQDEKNGFLWVNYDNIWSELRSKSDLNNHEISDLIKNIVEEHFKMKVNTPVS